MASDGAPTPEPRLGWATTVLIVSSVAVVSLFLGLMLAATDGHFVPQVVDLDVICQ
jgi:hypothetical protein